MTRGKAAIEIVKMWMCVLFIMNFRFERWHFYYSAADFDALYHAFFYGWKTFRKTFTEHLKQTTDFRADLFLLTWKKETTKKSSKTNSKMKRKIVGINAFCNRCHDRMWNTPTQFNILIWSSISNCHPQGSNALLSRSNSCPNMFYTDVKNLLRDIVRKLKLWFGVEI